VIEVAVWCALLAGQPDSGGTAGGPATWAEFYLDAAKQYSVKRIGDGQPIPLKQQAVFDWASISDFNGAVFAWARDGRPTLVATIFSFPLSGSKQRLAVHEFASFAEVDVVVAGRGGIEWKPPPLGSMPRVPEALPPPSAANLLKLHCRRLAKEFSAHMNRRGERWDLRLLPTPLVEYQPSGGEVLGGGLFAFVGYSTDPEILLLLEARQSTNGPAWHFQPVRFSDKSLYLAFKDKPVWESVRTEHGADGPDTEDPLYRVLSSTRLAPEVVERLSAASEKQ
jgi:hypothetical protein